MRELVDAMTDENPAKRPTIEEVIEKFDEIRSSLSTVKLLKLNQARDLVTKEFQYIDEEDDITVIEEKII